MDVFLLELLAAVVAVVLAVAFVAATVCDAVGADEKK